MKELKHRNELKIGDVYLCKPRDKQYVWRVVEIKSRYTKLEPLNKNAIEEVGESFIHGKLNHCYILPLYNSPLYLAMNESEEE